MPLPALARALQKLLFFVSLGFQNVGFSSRPLQYKDTPGKLWSFTMSYLSSLRLFPHTRSKLFSICQSIDKLLHISPDKCSHHQSHPWQYIWASQNKRLLNYKVTNSRPYKKQGALGQSLPNEGHVSLRNASCCLSYSQGRVWAMWHRHNGSEWHRAMSTPRCSVTRFHFKANCFIGYSKLKDLVLNWLKSCC